MIVKKIIKTKPKWRDGVTRLLDEQMLFSLECVSERHIHKEITKREKIASCGVKNKTTERERESRIAVKGAPIVGFKDKKREKSKEPKGGR
jgi:hypothetical protein